MSRMVANKRQQRSSSTTIESPSSETTIESAWSSATTIESASSSATTIGDLGDELLIEIFVRLPCYQTVIISEFVCKRWLSLLSKPIFVISFLNYNKQLPRKQQLPWTFLSTMRLNMDDIYGGDESDDRYTKRPLYYLPTHELFSSPKFTFNFLPFEFKVAATFKDLVLCLDVNDDQYVVCNPLTKKWGKLPPIRDRARRDDHKLTWAGLVCEDPYYNHGKDCLDCRFRVVVLDPIPPTQRYMTHEPYIVLSNLLVFCSEDFQWRKIDMKVPLTCNVSDFNSGLRQYAVFKGVVSKGMVCLLHKPYFGMFNPFEVTPVTSSSSDTNITLEARVLPICHKRSNKLFECGGRLVLITYDTPFFVHSAGFIKAPMTNFALDLKKLINDDEVVGPLNWSSFSRCCSSKPGEFSARCSSIHMIGMHPSNWTLLYVLVDKELILIDMALGALRLKRLGALHPDHLNYSFYGVATPRLELQHWPTPVPTIP